MLRFHVPLIEPDVRISRIRLSDKCRTRTHEMNAAIAMHRDCTQSPNCSLGESQLTSISSIEPIALSAASEPSLGFQTPRQCPASCCFRRILEPRPLPSTGITRLPRYYGPVRLPMRPGLSLTGIRLPATTHHRIGSPAVACFSSCRHAVVITPAEPQSPVAAVRTCPDPRL